MAIPVIIAQVIFWWLSLFDQKTMLDKLESVLRLTCNNIEVVNVGAYIIITRVGGTMAHPDIPIIACGDKTERKEKIFQQSSKTFSTGAQTV